MEDEDKELDMELGEEEEDVYTAEGRELLTDEDELETWEEGFMEGAEIDGQKAKCANCGKMVINENAIEKEVDNERLLFCSEDCVEKYEEKHSHH